jgi:superfamily I DNA and/or RNA helicase
VNWAARHFDLVVLDEASQMSLPEAVLASAFLKEGGQILVAGDHRQLPPILAHDWKEELRRDAETFRPYRSIFDFLLAAGAPVLPLDESFRLHRMVAAFLAEHIYREDGINFFSKRTETLPAQAYDEALVAAALHPDYPIIVIEHEERFSQRANALEAAIAAPIIAACSQVLGLDGRHGLGVVVPHTAQRALLSARFGELAAEGAIDTVDRFQGGERDVIVVSATVSDPDYALAESEFLLGVQRLNVAISRARKKLIVIAGASLFRLLPADVEIFRQASLWKLLRFGEHDAPLWQGQVDGFGVKVFGRRG